MAKKDSDRSGGGFWSFLRMKKRPSPEEEKEDLLGNKTAEQAPLEASKDESGEALLAHWEAEWEADAPSIEPPESSEEAKTQGSEPAAWQISEEAEVRKPETPEGESSEEEEAQESEQNTSESGTAVEELRVLEEQVASLESFIAERLEQRR